MVVSCNVPFNMSDFFKYVFMFVDDEDWGDQEDGRVYLSSILLKGAVVKPFLKNKNDFIELCPPDLYETDFKAINGILVISGEIGYHDTESEDIETYYGEIYIKNNTIIKFRFDMGE